jgi:hypothetical protein
LSKFRSSNAVEYLEIMVLFLDLPDIIMINFIAAFGEKKGIILFSSYLKKLNRIRLKRLK